MPWGFASLANVRCRGDGCGRLHESTACQHPDGDRGLHSRSVKSTQCGRHARARVGAPWRLPTLGSSRTGYCSRCQSIAEILAQAGAQLRHIERPGRRAPSTLLLGFPMAETKGAEPERMHWLAIGNMRTARRGDVRRGFSDRADARRRWDRALAADKRPLDYVKTANWAPDQIRRRGAAEDEVRGKSVLLIGSGTRGAVAENLVRMGVTRMGLVDADVMTRQPEPPRALHARIGARQSEGACGGAQPTMPDAKLWTSRSHSDQAAERKRLEGWDVVDCTAEDAVLRAMANILGTA